MSESILKKNDRVVVTWCDGEKIECIFIEKKNGFHILTGLDGKRVVCRDQYATIVKI